MANKKYIGDLFISNRWYMLLITCIVLLFIAFFIPILYPPVLAITCAYLFFTVLDYVLLFFLKGGIQAGRITTARFSLGDENNVTLSVANTYPFKINGLLIEELPVQFQERDFQRNISIGYRSRESITYTLRPLSRGKYYFGNIICYATTPLGLLQRRFKMADDTVVKVYPSYMQLRKYQLLAASDTVMAGTKKIRRLGHSLEFEKIKDYVLGDDVRTINWKATARSNNLMVNTYTDARQQQIYCLIDKGRSMKMPFEGMTLLDYSINSSLALLNIALLKQDKAGLITFSNKLGDIVPAERRSGQLQRIIDILYRQDTEFKESDYEAVWTKMHKSVSQRSLVLLFTNFETFSALQRQLPFLKKIAQRHLVCVVFFQNTLLKEIRESNPDSIEGVYIKTIAEQFDLEKKLIVKELRKHGVLSILTTPQTLTIDVINKYLELKARQMV